MLAWIQDVHRRSVVVRHIEAQWDWPCKLRASRELLSFRLGVTGVPVAKRVMPLNAHPFVKRFEASLSNGNS